MSLTSGPRRAGEPDGPEEMHLVLIDNGRTRLRESRYAEALQCIRCGACQNVCPVYRQVGGHAYGWVYGGPIGAVLTPLFRGQREAGELATPPACARPATTSARSRSRCTTCCSTCAATAPPGWRGR